MEEEVELFYGVDTSDMSVSQLNRLFREHDESNLWPICGGLMLRTGQSGGYAVGIRVVWSMPTLLMRKSAG